MAAGKVSGKVLRLCLQSWETVPPGARSEIFREEIGKEYERCQHCGALRRGRMFCRRNRLSGEKPRQGVFGLSGVSGRLLGVRPCGFFPKGQSRAKRSGKNPPAPESAEPEAALGTAAEVGEAPSAGFAESARRAEENRGTGENRTRRQMERRFGKGGKQTALINLDRSGRLSRI